MQGYLSNNPPVDLVHAVRSEVSSNYNKLPEGACHKLLTLGSRDKIDYTWGYRIYHLLQLPMPAKYEVNIPAGYAVKLFDAWLDMDWDFYGDDDSELESEEDEDMSEEEEDLTTRADDFIDDVGWFWIGVFHLVSFWMCEDNAAGEELWTSDKSWGGKRRPIYLGTSVPVEGCGDSECRAVNHGFALGEDVVGGEGREMTAGSQEYA